MTDYAAKTFTAPDGVKTWYRRYEAQGPGGKTPVVCLHGLTRNSRDFADIAKKIAAMGRDAIAIDVRGRGHSDRDPNPENYTPAVYVDDLKGVLAAEGLDRVVALGTSMGGIMTMILAAQAPHMIQAAILNDIGPELDPAGLARIQSYVGGPSTAFDSWADAARAVRAVNGSAFPDETGDAFWLAFAERVCRQAEDGAIVLDYDPAIAAPVKGGNAAPPDMWPLFDALHGVKLLLIRGAITDLLAQKTVDLMELRHPDMRTVDVPRVGHAPLLTEPEAWSAIEAFLSEIS